MYIELDLLGFDKGGNPQLFRDLAKDKTNLDKKPVWAPCLFDKDGFIGAIFVKDEKTNKARLLSAVELVRMKGYSWDMEQVFADTTRHITTESVHVYMNDSGDVQLVPKLYGQSLKVMPWK